jgi:hypothetical protein
LCIAPTKKIAEDGGMPMGNLWLKIKVGTKIAVFALLSLAVLIFVVENVNKNVTIWLWNDIQTTLLRVLFVTALVSVVFTILIGTAFRTARQIKELRARNRSFKLEQDLADMKAKAAMLQTKPPGASSAALDPVRPDEPHP